MRYFLLLTFLFSSLVWGSQISIPDLKAPVMDTADLLRPDQEADLNQLAFQIFDEKGPQITILTVPDLQGLEIEDFSIKVAEKWQLGSASEDNGILIVIAPSERKMRIEVGNGIEGEITDYDSNLYIRNILGPSFRAGNYHGGLRDVLLDIQNRFRGVEANKKGIIRKSPHGKSIPTFMVIFFFILIFAILVSQYVFRKKPLIRGLFTGISTTFIPMFYFGAGLQFLLIVFVTSFAIGLMGIHNFLYAVLRNGSFGSGGGFGGGGGRSWGGGGGGFSGGGSSGSW